MKNFQALGLSAGLTEAVERIGFEKPTPVQERAIPLLLTENRDFIGLAQTGTGKTAAFGLPLLDLIDESQSGTQALILAPTRELGVQIARDLEEFSKSFKRLNIVAVYGGASISDQIRKIKKGAHVVVATPGRLLDVIGRKAIALHTVQYVVLDEADEMLNMGFKEDIDEILSSTPATKRTWLFSATMPREVRAIANSYMSNPIELTIGNKNEGNANIEHQYVVVNERDKYPALKRILDNNPNLFGLIFCRTRIDTQRIADNLLKDGYNADSIHGDLNQAQRDKVMAKFRKRDLQLLVATDVAARGIDVDNISHVIHMNLPDEIEFYTHRSGRTARAGKTGISIALITPKESGKIRQIEKVANTLFSRITTPTGNEICKTQLMSLAQRVLNASVNKAAIEEFMPMLYNEFKNMTKEEVIRQFASLEFNRIIEYYMNTPDLTNELEKKNGSTYPSGDRCFINLGKMDDMTKADFLEMIDECCGVGKKYIGKIDIKGAYSFFEVASDKSEQVIDGLRGVEFMGRQVRVERTEKRAPVKQREAKQWNHYSHKKGQRSRAS